MFIGFMCIFDIQTMKRLICHWFCVYFVHSDRQSGAAGCAYLGCLGWLNGWWRFGPAEIQKVLNFRGNNEGHFPGLYVFQYLLTLMNAKYTFLDWKRFWHVGRDPLAHLYYSFSYAARVPLEQALFGE